MNLSNALWPVSPQNSFQEMLNTLREKLEVAKSVLADEQERMVMIQVSTCLDSRKKYINDVG